MKIIILLTVLGAVTAGPIHRIVNGESATKHEFPHIASLQVLQFGFYWAHSCGATLISKNYVLTAAHCVDSSVNNMRVQLGRHNLNDNNEESAGQTIHIAEKIVHSGWNPNADGFPNDMALLLLSEPANLVSGLVETIDLASGTNDYSGIDVILAGWGKLQGSDSSTSTILQKLSIPVISNEVCADLWEIESGTDTEYVKDSHICANDVSANVGACNGDSGGPMYCPDGNGGINLCGVTSWGKTNCPGTSPSVYSRVSHFEQWIRTNSDV